MWPMSLIQLYFSITMEKSSKNTNQFPSPIFAVMEVFLSIILFNWVFKLQKFFSRNWSVLQSQLHCYNLKLKDGKKDSDFELSSKEKCVNEKKDDGNLCREEVDMLMGKLGNLGICCSPESEEFPQYLGSDELSGLFEEKEPSLEEVKEAFDVFDENRDGFIDARELQRVLCMLGLQEGSELENCNRMIKTFDQNGDERIDFNEFVKFMENSFC